jgi:RimJ/RimL family protein N-acetyltransferase
VPHNVHLRDVAESDLPLFFEQQVDPIANHMAAFTTKHPQDRGAFDAHWRLILGDATILKKTILFDGQVAGYIVRFEQFGKPQVGYWLGSVYWGQGIATRALATFLDAVEERPLYARVARDNVGSLRVLEKCGFTICGQGRAFSNARGAEIDELILRLDDEQRE